MAYPNRCRQWHARVRQRSRPGRDTVRQRNVLTFRFASPPRWLDVPTGGDASRATEGPDASNRVQALGPGLHQVRAEAVLGALQFRGELHQRHCVQVLRHERVRVGAANEVTTGRRRDVA